MTGHGGRRRCAGRKRSLQDARRVTVHLDAQSIAKIAIWCDALGLTQAEAVRALIARAPAKPNK